MGIDVAAGGLLVKQPAGLRPLMHKSEMNFTEGHPLDGAVFLSADKDAAFAPEVRVGDVHVPDDAGEAALLPAPGRSADEMSWLFPTMLH